MNLELFDIIKNDFNALWQYKFHANSIEIITPFSTSCSSVVSVFITKQGENYFVSDGGWLSKNVYELMELDYKHPSSKVPKVVEYFAKYYRINLKDNGKGLVLYYKNCTDMKLVSAFVFDVAHFICHTIGCLGFELQEADEQTIRFRQQANNYFKGEFTDGIVKLGSPLDDVKNANFSAIIENKNELFLVIYISGSTKHNFSNSIKKATTNFELAEESKYQKENILKGKIPLVDDSASGFQPKEFGNLFDLLKKRTAVGYFPWTNRGKVVELIKNPEHRVHNSAEEF